MNYPALLCAVVMLSLAACSGGSDNGDNRSDRLVIDPATPVPTASPRADAVGLEPTPLTESDLREVTLAGELGCSFARRIGGEALFLGQGDVGGEEAEGVVKLEGQLRRLSMRDAGGYDAMANGARFVGEGLSVAIDIIDDEPIVEEPGIAMESTAKSATMTVLRDDAKDVATGIFECGP